MSILLSDIYKIIHTWLVGSTGLSNQKVIVADQQKAVKPLIPYISFKCILLENKVNDIDYETNKASKEVINTEYSTLTISINGFGDGSFQALTKAQRKLSLSTYIDAFSLGYLGILDKGQVKNWSGTEENTNLERAQFDIILSTIDVEIEQPDWFDSVGIESSGLFPAATINNNDVVVIENELDKAISDENDVIKIDDTINSVNNTSEDIVVVTSENSPILSENINSEIIDIDVSLPVSDSPSAPTPIPVNPDPVPVTPVALAATNQTDSAFRANWERAILATSYKLYVDDILAYEGSDLYFDVINTPRGDHSYYVQAINSTGISNNSNIISVTIDFYRKYIYYSKYNNSTAKYDIWKIQADGTGNQLVKAAGTYSLKTLIAIDPTETYLFGQSGPQGGKDKGFLYNISTGSITYTNTVQPESPIQGVSGAFSADSSRILRSFSTHYGSSIAFLVSNLEGAFVQIIGGYNYAMGVDVRDNVIVHSEYYTGGNVGYLVTGNVNTSCSSVATNQNTILNTPHAYALNCKINPLYDVIGYSSQIVGGIYQLFIIGINGNDITQITFGGSSKFFCGWDYSGTRMLYYDNSTGVNELYYYDTVLSQSVQITNNGVNSFCGIWCKL